MPALAIDRLANNIKSGATPDTFSTQIDGLIKLTIKDFNSSDPVKQQQARTILINESENHAGQTSPQFAAFYASHFAKAALPMFKGKLGTRARLNLAVVTAEVAMRCTKMGGSTVDLRPLVEVLLQDKATPVVLWGIKAARYVMGDTLQLGAQLGQIPALVVKAPMEHPDSAPIIEEAYLTLTVDQIRNNPNFAALVTPLVEPLLNLMQWRNQQYHDPAGVVPPSPLAELPANPFLSVYAFDGIKNKPALLTRTLRVTGSLTCSVIGSIKNGNTSPEILELVHALGNTFISFGEQLNSNLALSTAGKHLTSVSATTLPNTLDSRCNEIVTSLKSVGADISPDGVMAGPVNPALAGPK
jgi:hypothetical protein